MFTVDPTSLSVLKSKSIEHLFAEICSFDRISVVLPDCTRPLPFEKVLPILEKVFPNLEHWVVGLGLHRSLTEAERLRFQCLTTKPILEHDPDRCIDIDVVEGVSIGIFEPLLQTAWTLTVGVMEVHQYAGVSGGYKGVVVGCGSRTSIERLHRRELVCDDRVVVGAIVGNPFRAEIERLGKNTQCRFGLQWVPSLNEWWFGTPEALLAEAQTCIQPWYEVDRLYPGVVLNIPKSKGVSLYQASRAATYLALSPNPPLVERATIVLKASMVEGLGAEKGFVNALKSHKPPWETCLGKDIPGAGAQRIWMLARLANRYRLVLTGVEDPALFHEVGIPVISELEIKEEWLYLQNPFKQIPQYRTVT